MEILPAERVVTFYGNIAESVLKLRREPEYCVYAVACSMKRSDGANGLPKDALIKELKRLRMFASAAHVRSLLRSGQGIFWTLKADRVWLYSTERLAWRLGARPLNAHRHLVSTALLRQRDARRAAVMGAAIPVGRPIMQRTIRRLTGVSERSQREYRARRYLGARRQDAEVMAAFDAPTPALRRLAAHQERHHGVYAVGTDATLWKRVPNEYFPAGTRIPRGRRSKQIFGRPLIAVAEGALTDPRVYFENASKWMRCRRLRLGTVKAQPLAYPFNVSYVRAAPAQWEAVAC
jgi:hypothetical protein